MNIRDSFEQTGFTPEEKIDLTARLERAAELDENMTNAAKRKMKKISGGMIFGVAAVAIMTVGALAAVLNPGLRTWLDTATPGAPEVLENSIYRLDRSETCSGWTVTLGECVGDDNSVYIQVDLTAPEGTVLAPREDGYLSTEFSLILDERHSRGGMMTMLPDNDPSDNRISLLIQDKFQDESLRGKTVTVSIAPIVECWWTDRLTDKAQLHKNGGLTAAIQDHTWVFEDVTLDFPDQTIRLEPNTELPCLGGTATLTGLEVSPLSVKMVVEGGSCARYLKLMNSSGPSEEIVILPDGGLSITVAEPAEDRTEEIRAMRASLALEVVLQDGTVLLPTSKVAEADGTKDGIEGPDTPYLTWSLRYDDTNNFDSPTRIVDPAQVDHVTVCGVNIPVNPAEQ